MVMIHLPHTPPRVMTTYKQRSTSMSARQDGILPERERSARTLRLRQTNNDNRRKLRRHPGYRDVLGAADNTIRTK